MAHKDVVSRATAALKESVASIVSCDDDDATKHAALAETFMQFATYLDRNGGDIVEKAGGVHDLAGRLIEHLADALDAKRERHGFAKSEKESNMDSIDAIMKSGGIGPTCAAIVAKGSTNISEHALVEAATAVASDRHPELSASQAFSKIFSASTDEARVLREAINVAKQSAVISGGDLRDANDVAQAMDQLREIGRRMAPTASAEKQFAVAFEDPKNVALALRVHQRPRAMTSFPFPR
jgi:hypothetical protein